MARRAAVAVGAIFLTTTYMGSCAAARESNASLSFSKTDRLPDDHKYSGVRAGRARGQAHPPRSLIRLRLGRNADP
jgi:hypothetical protein